MFKFIHHLLQPHCLECKQEREDSRICPSCETLKSQISRLEYENDRLFARILEKPAETIQEKSVEVSRPKNIPWNIRRQMLESEDRERAKLMRNAPVPTEDLEKELGIVEAERENSHAIK